MPTIEELLGEETTVEKTASADRNELNKLAAELGLIDEDEPETLNKEASMALHEEYLDRFPGDEDLLGQEKVAAEEQEADELEKEAEEAMGAYAYDVFDQCVVGHISKIATALVQAETSGETHPQSMANNEDTSEDEIDTTPEYQTEAMGTNPKGAVGQFEMKSAPHGEQVKKASASFEDLFSVGFDKMAAASADELDKLAEGNEDEDEDEDEEKEDKAPMKEEHKKEATARGAILARSYVEGLMKQGSARHGDPLHYLYDAIEADLVKQGAAKKDAKSFVEGLKEKAKKAYKTVKNTASKGYDTAKEQVGKATKATKKYHTDAVKQLSAAVTGGSGKKKLDVGKRLALGAKGAVKFLPHAGVLAGLGYGAHKMMGKKEQDQAQG